MQDEITQGNWVWLLGMRVSDLRQVFDYADYLPVPGQIHLGQSDRAITPRVGVSWHVLPSLRWYANYAAGNMATLPQSRQVSGAAFAPLSNRQVESGIKWQPEHANWLASLAVFDIQRNHVLTPDPNNPGFSIQTGKQGSRGIEAEWQGKIAPRWQLRTQATWLNARILQDNLYATGNRLPYVPRFGMSAWLSHRLQHGSDTGYWRISGGIVHQGERCADFANTTRLPAYTRLDLGITYQAKSHSLTLSVENAANLRYYSSGVENRPAVIYPGTPRTLSFKLNYDLS